MGSNSLAFLFPGQGSQRAGMGRSLAEHFAVARQVFEEADDVLGFPLSRLCFEGSANALTDTVNTQPAILAVSIAALRALHDATDGALSPSCVAGNSMGEYTALVAAGVLSLADGLRLVRLRGELMSEAGRANPGGMAALIGLDADAVEELCRRAAAQGGVVQVANDNAPGQVIVSGDEPTLERLIELAKTAGARRIVRLAVSVAGHSVLMAGAADGLRGAVEAVPMQPPGVVVVGNVQARPLADVQEIRQELVEQMTAPVRWTDTIRSMSERGVTHFLEFGPGDVLRGLVRRIEKNAEAASVGDAESLAEVKRSWFDEVL